MYANDLALGRNHYTADSAKLITFHDCARAELHWNDGAMVSNLCDTQDEAVEYLREHGFVVKDDVRIEEADQGVSLKAELVCAVAELKAANEARGRGDLRWRIFNYSRGELVRRAVVALAALQGAELEPLGKMGQLCLKVKHEGVFGATFASTLKTHCRPYTHRQQDLVISESTHWCYITESCAERMVLACTA